MIRRYCSRDGKVVEAPCLIVAKPEDIPKTFFLNYCSTIHKIDSSNKYYISPLNEEGVLIDPQNDIIQKFMEKVDLDIKFAKVLASFALSSE